MYVHMENTSSKGDPCISLKPPQSSGIVGLGVREGEYEVQPASRSLTIVGDSLGISTLRYSHWL